MGRFYRPRMLGGEIQKLIGDMLIRGQFKDPGFAGRLIGINDVEVSADGSYATVYITAIASGSGKELTDEEKKGVLDAFARSKGYLRTEIGRAIKLRHVPDLIFKLDSSYEYGIKMDRLIDSLDIPEEE